MFLLSIVTITKATDVFPFLARFLFRGMCVSMSKNSPYSTLFTLDKSRSTIPSDFILSWLPVPNTTSSNHNILTSPTASQLTSPSPNCATPQLTSLSQPFLDQVSPLTPSPFTLASSTPSPAPYTSASMTNIHCNPKNSKCTPNDHLGQGWYFQITTLLWLSYSTSIHSRLVSTETHLIQRCCLSHSTF